MLVFFSCVASKKWQNIFFIKSRMDEPLHFSIRIFASKFQKAYLNTSDQTIQTTSGFLYT